MATLRITSSPHPRYVEKVFPLRRNVVTIGSSPSCDVSLDHESIADTHAIIQCDGSSFVIQVAERGLDLSINGKKKRKLTLCDADEIAFGDFSMHFHLLHVPVQISPNQSSPITSADHVELEAFRQMRLIAEQVRQNVGLEATLTSIIDGVIEITRASKGFLVLFRDGEHTIQVARDNEREDIEDAVDHVSDSIIKKVMESGESILINDALQDDEFNSSQSVIDLNLQSVLCVPLLDRQNLIGLIYVGSEKVTNLFTNVHRDLVIALASQASLLIANAILVDDLVLDKARLQQRLEEKRFGSIIGACDAMREVFRTIEKVAPTNVNVLILGETGTGKELIAHEIHNRSSRASGPFVTINCGAIPENLLESELFGHVKGSFTGASATREGKFQAAEKGTIFLDEIGEMPLNLQVKLLRVLQERTITKVGATKSEKVDIRVVAATNRDLEEAVGSGEFREDLYYRLNVVRMHLPPLRARGDDVVLIARYLIKEIARDLGVSPKQISAEATQAMRHYRWPGNIRQLENRLKKALVLADGATLTSDDLELAAEDLEEIIPLAEAKEQFAFRYIMEALEKNGGNRTQTARDLEVDPRTIFRYLEKDL